MGRMYKMKQIVHVKRFGEVKVSLINSKENIKNIPLVKPTVRSYFLTFIAVLWEECIK